MTIENLLLAIGVVAMILGLMTGRSPVQAALTTFCMGVTSLFLTLFASYTILLALLAFPIFVVCVGGAAVILLDMAVGLIVVTAFVETAERLGL